MNFKPGDLIVRVSDAPFSSLTSTCLYEDCSDNPATRTPSTTKDSHAVIQLIHTDRDLKMPAIIVSLALVSLVREDLKPENVPVYAYAFVVWPGFGVGWIWLGSQESLTNDRYMGHIRWRIFESYGEV